ncbi:hypothetical protein CEXT_390231 [Caerostris extrusa]|uniref:Uncharacterized protein n=1 Tax=Caerostris extrusa TaxID=172846 RepID=A0AAV4QCI1_CAEEX|nr:hypothetical protein CEXT_390231 [Caerostris extrusa]
MSNANVQYFVLNTKSSSLKNHPKALISKEYLNQSLRHPNRKDSPSPKNTNKPAHRSLFIKERKKVLVGGTGTTRRLQN